MNLAQTFRKAIRNHENWYLQNGVPTPNWNFIDADCYMACGNEYPNSDAFYDEWNALCDLYIMSRNADSLLMREELGVDTVADDAILVE